MERFFALQIFEEKPYAITKNMTSRPESEYFFTIAIFILNSQYLFWHRNQNICHNICHNKLFIQPTQCQLKTWNLACRPILAFWPDILGLTFYLHFNHLRASTLFPIYLYSTNIGIGRSSIKNILTQLPGNVSPLNND